MSGRILVEVLRGADSNQQQQQQDAAAAAAAGNTTTGGCAGNTTNGGISDLGDLRQLAEIVRRLADDTEACVRMELVEQMPNAAAACRLRRDPRLEPLVRDTLLGVVVDCLRDTEDVVRKSSQAALLMLMDQGLVDRDLVEARVCPAVLRLSEDTPGNSAVCNPLGGTVGAELSMAAVALMSKMAPLLGSSATERLFLSRFAELCSEETFCVRKMCAAAIGELSAVVGSRSCEQTLLPKFLQLCSDDIWGVRKACADAAPVVSHSLSSTPPSAKTTCHQQQQQQQQHTMTSDDSQNTELGSTTTKSSSGVDGGSSDITTNRCSCGAATSNTRRDLLSPVYVSLLEDNSRWVRMSAFQNLGAFIATFAEPCITGLAYNGQGELVLTGVVPADHNELTNISVQQQQQRQQQQQQRSSTQQQHCSDKNTLLIDMLENSTTTATSAANESESNSQQQSDKQEETAESSSYNAFSSPQQHNMESDNTWSGDTITIVNSTMEQIQVYNDETDHNTKQNTTDDSNHGTISGDSKNQQELVEMFHDYAAASSSIIGHVPEVVVEDYNNHHEDITIASVDIKEPDVRITTDDDGATIVMAMDDTDIGDFYDNRFWCIPPQVLDLNELGLQSETQTSTSSTVFFDDISQCKNSTFSFGNEHEHNSSSNQTPSSNDSSNATIDLSVYPINASSSSEEEETCIHGQTTTKTTNQSTIAVAVQQNSCSAANSSSGNDDEMQELVPQALIKHFVSMVDPDYGAQLDNESSYHCAYSFPAVARTLGKSHWPLLKHTYETLASDMQWKVRRTIASSLHEVADVLGVELASRDLAPVFEAFIKDVDEVRIGVLRRMAQFFKTIRHSERSQFLPRLDEFRKTDNCCNWRFRQELAEQLLICVRLRLFTAKQCDEHLRALAVELLRDKVVSVRKAAAELVAALVQQLSENELKPSSATAANKPMSYSNAVSKKSPSERILTSLAEEFAMSEMWSRRQTYAQLCGLLLNIGNRYGNSEQRDYQQHYNQQLQSTTPEENSSRTAALPHERFETEVLRYLLPLSWDNVPNVRLVTARVLVQDVLTYEYFTNLDRCKSCNDIQFAVHQLRSDDDRDVRFHARLATDVEQENPDIVVTPSSPPVNMTGSSSQLQEQVFEDSPVAVFVTPCSPPKDSKNDEQETHNNEADCQNVSSETQDESNHAENSILNTKMSKSAISEMVMSFFSHCKTDTTSGAGTAVTNAQDDEGDNTRSTNQIDCSSEQHGEEDKDSDMQQ